MKIEGLDANLNRYRKLLAFAARRYAKEGWIEVSTGCNPPKLSPYSLIERAAWDRYVAPHI